MAGRNERWGLEALFPGRKLENRRGVEGCRGCIGVLSRGRYEAGWRGWRRSSPPLIALPRGTRFINFFLFLFFLFFPPRARFSSAQLAARRVTGGGPPDIDWKLGKLGILIGQGSPLSSSCQSGAWLNLWMIKRWMVSARVVKSPRFEPRSWSFPRYILFTWHVTWLFHVSMKLRAGNSTRFGEFLNLKWFHVQIETFNILIFHVSLRVEIEG